MRWSLSSFRPSLSSSGSSWGDLVPSLRFGSYSDETSWQRQALLRVLRCPRTSAPMSALPSQARRRRVRSLSPLTGARPPSDTEVQAPAWGFPSAKIQPLRPRPPPPPGCPRGPGWSWPSLPGCPGRLLAAHSSDPDALSTLRPILPPWPRLPQCHHLPASRPGSVTGRCPAPPPPPPASSSPASAFRIPKWKAFFARGSLLTRCKRADEEGPPFPCGEGGLFLDLGLACLFQRSVCFPWAPAREVGGLSV